MVDEVFPITIADGEVGVVFLEAVTEAGSIGWSPPEDGSLIGLGLVDEVESFVDETGGDFGALHPLGAFAEAFGIGPDFADDRVATFGVGLESEGKELGADAFEVGELDSLGGESVDVLGFYFFAEAGEVGVAHVIDEDHDDVGPG